MAINSKQKGAAFERQVCKILSKWWGGEFTREFRSGRGDIKTPDDFPWSVECKHYKDFNPLDIFSQKDPVILRFWEQAERDAEAQERLSMMFIKRNNRPTLCCVDNCGSLSYTPIVTTNMEVKIETPEFAFTIFNADDLPEYSPCKNEPPTRWRGK